MKKADERVIKGKFRGGERALPSARQKTEQLMKKVAEVRCRTAARRAKR
ncbi:hypothetical protein [Paenibacillus sp. 1P07SE]